MASDAKALSTSSFSLKRASWASAGTDGFASFPDERSEGRLTLPPLQQLEFEPNRYGIAPPYEAFHLHDQEIDNSPQRDQTFSRQ